MLRRLLYIIFPLLMVSSCQRIFVNGDLDGMWKLVSVEDPVSQSFPDNIYYSFQRHLVMLGEYYEEEFPEYYMAEFEKKGDELTMYKFYRYPGKEPECDMSELEKYYIFSDTVHFIVEKLDDEILLMRDGDRCYSFTKW